MLQADHAISPHEACAEDSAGAGEARVRPRLLNILAYGLEDCEIKHFRFLNPLNVLQEQELANYRLGPAGSFPALTERKNVSTEDAQANRAQTREDMKWADVLFTERYTNSIHAAGLEELRREADIPWVLDIEDHVLKLDPEKHLADQFGEVPLHELGDVRPIRGPEDVRDGEKCFRDEKTGEFAAVKLKRDWTRGVTWAQICAADALIAGTRQLRIVYAQIRRRYWRTAPNGAKRGRVYCIPYSVDPRRWEGLEEPEDHSPEVWIGWLGADEHDKDLELVAPIIGELLKKHKHVRFFWKRGHSLQLEELAERYPKRCLHLQRWVPHDEWPRYVALSGIDIFLAPLVETPFNQCRSPMKWMEAAMLKKPCVCSDIDGYADAIDRGRDGFLCSRPAQWERSLESLIASAQRRNEMGSKAHEKVMERYNIRKNAARYREVFESVLADYDGSV